MADQQQALFLSHGGGPLPLLGDESHREMVRCLEGIAAMIRQPSAIIVVSAHWEESHVRITSGAKPRLIYDYSGFPEESYSISYPCPGNPVLAEKIATALAAAGVEASQDNSRGFDHGLFVPLKIMYPQATIPCVQISLLKSLDAADHISIGRALRTLADPSILLVGSGFSFHNMKAFFTPETSDGRAMNQSFENWLQDTCCNPELGEEERVQRLTGWQSAPGARYCHPREEHLLPLHVCYGYTASVCPKSFRLQILNKQSSMYLWHH